MIEWGQKWNPKKSRGLTTKPKQTPRPKINLKKNPMLNFRALTISLEIKCLCLFILHTIWILRLLWIPKNSRFKSSHSKENLARLCYPKESQNLKFHNHYRQSLWSLFFVKTLCLIFLANYLHLGLRKCPILKTLLRHKGYFPYLQPGWHPQT